METKGYPPPASRWTIQSDHHYAEAALHSIVVTRGLSVYVSRDLDGNRAKIRPDSISAKSVLWTEHDDSRAHLMSCADKVAIVLISQSGRQAGTVSVSVASNDLELAHKIIAEYDRLLPHEQVTSEAMLPVLFWHRAGSAELTERRIEVASWEGINENYSGTTRTHLSRLMDRFTRAKTGGRILLWHGEPGTGKTFAIRSLARAWREWCRFEYVIDPEELFGNASYLTEVMLQRFEGHYLFPENPREETWRLLIIEDSGELMATAAQNQSLSRLLNLSDGILGQGSKLLILITTNENLRDLNPAIRRHGRCLSDIEFRRFSKEEAARWLRRARCNAHVNASQTLAELYAMKEGRELVERTRRIGFAPERSIGVTNPSCEISIGREGVSK